MYLFNSTNVIRKLATVFLLSSSIVASANEPTEVETKLANLVGSIASIKKVNGLRCLRNISNLQTPCIQPVKSTKFQTTIEHLA